MSRLTAKGMIFGGYRPRQDATFDTDRAQAMIRIVMATAIVTYLLALWLVGATEAPEGRRLTFAVLLYFPSMLALTVWIVRRPGVHPVRRAVSILLDYVGLTWVLCVGGPETTPVFAVLLWVTVGNGLRFGPNYLVAATGLALCAVMLAAGYNGYWTTAPYLVVTLLLANILVPIYILVLLRRLHSAYKDAREANLSKSRFLAQASHDLRQPIHAISLFTACLRDAGLRPSELEMVENIDRSLLGVSRLFKSLLDVSTLDSGRVVPRPEAVAVAEIIEDIVRQNSEAAQRAGTALHAVRSSAWIEADRGLLTTMVQNVVNNAIKYAPGGAILIGCRRRAHGTVALCVCDQGPGIAREHRERVFDEFYQVRVTGDRDIEGVGLGLPIVARLARLLGLEVALRSTTGRGTSVEIGGLRMIPRVPAPAVPAQKDLSGPIAGLRVLLVEDDEAVLSATASLLRRWNCTVQEETTVPAGAAPCDLLVTDFDLGGGVTGAECIARVRAANGFPVPAVIVSGHDPMRIAEELADPDIPILSKPIRPAELRSVILTASLMTVAGPFRGRPERISRAESAPP